MKDLLLKNSPPKSSWVIARSINKQGNHYKGIGSTNKYIGESWKIVTSSIWKSNHVHKSLLRFTKDFVLLTKLHEPNFYVEAMSHLGWRYVMNQDESRAIINMEKLNLEDCGPIERKVTNPFKMGI